MVKCPKCDSQLPSKYKYCIYCSHKLPKTEENSNKEDLRAHLTTAQFGIAICAILVLAVLTAVPFIL